MKRTQELTVVGAGEYCQFDLIELGVFRRSGLGLSYGTRLRGATYGELVIVCGKWLQPSCFNLRVTSLCQDRFYHIKMGLPHLNGIVNITCGISSSTGDGRSATPSGRDFPVHANRICVSLDIALRLVVIQRHGAFDSDVAVTGNKRGCNSRPEDDTVRVRVTRGNTVSEIQLVRRIGDCITLVATA